MIASIPEGKRMKELSQPLVRLKIEHSGFPVIKSKKLNDYYMNKLANPQDFLQFYKKSSFMPNLNVSNQLLSQTHQTQQQPQSVSGGASSLFNFEDNDENLRVIDRIIK